MHSHSIIHPIYFNDPATTVIYTLSLHDALPIFYLAAFAPDEGQSLDFIDATKLPKDFLIFDSGGLAYINPAMFPGADRKSTRLNSSHSQISYAVFCLKKKKTRVISTLV